MPNLKEGPNNEELIRDIFHKVYKVDPESTTHKIAKILKGVWGFSPRCSLYWLLVAVMVTFRTCLPQQNVETAAECWHRSRRAGSALLPQTDPFYMERNNFTFCI